MRLRCPSALMLALAGWAVCRPAGAADPDSNCSESATAHFCSRHRLALPSGFRASNEADYALTLAGFAGTSVLLLGFRVNSPRWDGAILFDDAARNALGASSRSRRSAYNLASNLTVASSVAWVAFDALGLAWAIEGNPRVARELVWMDAEAYAFSTLLTNVTKRVAARRRPYAAACLRDPSYVGDCGTSEENISFFSGHSTMSGTSAGLICAQHGYLRLYGGVGDAFACAGALGVMTATGVLRIASDNHWASDVAVGYLVGFASGYGLPWLLHFRGTEKPRAARSSEFQLAVLPLSDGTRTSVFAVGRF